MMVTKFENFKSVTKEEVLAKIEADLKSKSFEDIQWQVEHEITLDPIHFQNDSPTFNGIPQKDNDWSIGGSYIGNDASALNKVILESLNSGLELIKLNLDEDHAAQLHSILKGVILDYVQISLCFNGKINAEQVIQSLVRLCEEQNISTTLVHGNICYISDQEEAIQKILTEFPSLKLLIPSYENHSTPENLAQQIDLAVQCLHHPSLENALGFEKITFQQSLGHHFVYEVSKLRALRLLWLNIQNNYPTPIVPIHIEAQIKIESLKADMYTNMIQTTAQSVAAIIGGANTLIAMPTNQLDEVTSFSRRIAQNIQHVMKMESFMNRVHDPSKGAYSFEVLTHNIANASWKAFIQKQEN